MKFLPITLGIARASGNPSSSSGPKLRRATVMTPEQRTQILERDQHTCQCCGFQSKKYQEVLVLNQVPGDFKPENLKTVCQFCHQCFHLDQVVSMKSGVVIWMPEIDQSTLNHILRAIYVAQVSQGPISDAARKVKEMILARREDARKRLGSDDVFVLASVLRDYMTDRLYAERAQKLEGIRLMALDRRIIKEGDLEFNQFPQIVAYWRSKDGPYGGKIPSQWVEFFKKTMRAAA